MVFNRYASSCSLPYLLPKEEVLRDHRLCATGNRGVYDGGQRVNQENDDVLHVGAGSGKLTVRVKIMRTTTRKGIITISSRTG